MDHLPTRGKTLSEGVTTRQAEEPLCSGKLPVSDSVSCSFLSKMLPRIGLNLSVGFISFGPVWRPRLLHTERSSLKISAVREQTYVRSARVYLCHLNSIPLGRTRMWCPSELLATS
jgi:hypothetical protein